MQTSPPLVSRHCMPPESGTFPLTSKEYTPFLQEIPGWDVVGGKQLVWDRTFENFSEAMAFVDKIASIAEEEQHHPDISLHDYKHVRVTLSTHSIGGLSENDFIMAAKINQLD